MTALAAAFVLTLALSGCDGGASAPELPALPPKVAAPTLGDPGESRPLRELIVAFTGEVRGEIEPCGCPTVPYGGFVRRGAVLDRLRAEGLPVVVLDVGEMLVRGQVATDPGDRPERARAVLDLARAVGLDAWAPGPVDLSAGGLGTLSGTSALAATWRDGVGEAVFPGATVIERDGLRIGVVGVNAPAEGLGAADPIEGVRAAIALAEATGGPADTWVALSNASPADNRRVAEGVPGLGAVLSTRGGEHDPPLRTQGAPIIETPDRGRYLTVLRVALGSEGAAWQVVDGGAVEELARERERVTRLEDPVAKQAGTARVGEIRARLEAEFAGHDVVLVEDRPLGSDLDGPSALDGRIELFKARSTDAAKVRAASAPEVAGYTTAAACTSCHRERFNTWAFDPHARAYEALLPRKAELNPECVACHTTAWGKPGGNASPTAVAMRTWKGVQCEACHGPLAGHPQRADVVPSAVTEATCLACHDAANSPQFDFEAYRKRISCASVSQLEAEEREAGKLQK
ncbi:MAG: multiheme c-type cytochrome [Pseudomonadota bacterium]|nr:multiheme c-type cytochrome [Pseudomonadota bacterium]